jgi:chitin disaccharide deacetylase
VIDRVAFESGRMSAIPALLINADDFGLHEDIDRGILDCIEQGRIQSISFSPQGQSLEWKKLPDLQRHGVRVGLHVTLIGEPWLSDGRLIHNWKALIQQLLVSAQMRHAVEAEISRQFHACAEHGLDPQSLAHVDSHQHVHAFGGIWQPCLKLARQFGIPRVRVPWCPSWRIIKKNAGGIALQAIASRRRRDVAGFLPCMGIAHAGHNTTAILKQELACGIKQDCELVAHPGVNSSGLESRYADWRFDWTGERDSLLSQEFAEAVAANGFRFA